MQRISLLFSVLVVCFVTLAQAQTTAPKPDPELKKLHVFLGHWMYECDYKSGPLGPASKVNGEYTNQMILGGFFMKGQWMEKGSTGVEEAIEVFRYDPGNKNFAYSGYINDGSTYSGTLTISGSTVSAAEKFLIGGKEYMTKVAMTFAADGMSATWNADISTDGKTWVPWFEQKMTKVKPAAKK